MNKFKISVYKTKKKKKTKIVWHCRQVQIMQYLLLIYTNDKQGNIERIVDKLGNFEEDEENCDILIRNSKF